MLYGDAEPGGRLPVTFPADEHQGPTTYTGGKNDGAYGSITYDEGVHVGYKWYGKHRAEPLFPFGHGPSYTSFRYDSARVHSRGRGDEAAEVTVEVRNTGRRTGSDVVQVYTGHLPTATDTPARTLVGFARVELAAGRHRSVSVTVSRRALSYWDEDGNRWVTPTGKVPVHVGRCAVELDHVGTITVR
ncbi:fibronectin type III-like domain-contianing protein [Streptomyces tauricus]